MNSYSRSRKRAIVVIAMTCLVGCTIVEEPSPQELCNQLVVGDQIRDEVLFELMRPPQRREKLTALFGEWGRRSDTYDEAVLQALCCNSDRIDADLLHAAKARLREEPELLLQVVHRSNRTYLSGLKELENAPPLPDYYYDGRDYFGRNKTNSPWMMDCFYDSAFRLAPATDGARIMALIDVAACFNRPELILNLTMDNLDQQWAKEKAWLRENARYVYFVEESGTYAIDEDAARNKEPVAPERQQPKDVPVQ